MRDGGCSWLPAYACLEDNPAMYDNGLQIAEAGLAELEE